MLASDDENNANAQLQAKPKNENISGGDERVGEQRLSKLMEEARALLNQSSTKPNPPNSNLTSSLSNNLIGGEEKRHMTTTLRNPFGTSMPSANPSSNGNTGGSGIDDTSIAALKARLAALSNSNNQEAQNASISAAKKTSNGQKINSSGEDDDEEEDFKQLSSKYNNIASTVDAGIHSSGGSSIAELRQRLEETRKAFKESLLQSSPIRHQSAFINENNRNKLVHSTNTVFTTSTPPPLNINAAGTNAAFTVEPRHLSTDFLSHSSPLHSSKNDPLLNGARVEATLNASEQVLARAAEARSHSAQAQAQLTAVLEEARQALQTEQPLEKEKEGLLARILYALFTVAVVAVVHSIVTAPQAPCDPESYAGIDVRDWLLEAWQAGHFNFANDGRWLWGFARQGGPEPV